MFSPTNEWKFPAGTVFVKHFELPINDTNAAITQRVETRLLVVDQNGAAYGLTYKWRLRRLGRRSVDDRDQRQFYYYWRRLAFCRNPAWISEPFGLSVFAILPTPLCCSWVKTHQLNCSTTYPETGITDNQLRALGNIGLFGTNYSEAQLGSYLRSYSVTNTSVSLELRARSYLDANCSQCHRPGGVLAYFDARFVTPLSRQGLDSGDLAYTFITDTNDRVVMHDLPHSLVYNRASRVGQYQMPPLAKNLVDADAMLTISNWINSLPSGPGVILSASANNVTGPFGECRCGSFTQHRRPDFKPIRSEQRLDNGDVGKRCEL